MKLSSKAIRFISFGVRQLDARAQEVWLRWVDRQHDGVITPDIAPIVDSALVALEHHILDAVIHKTTIEDVKADMMNDVGFIHAIQSDLKKQFASHH
jgi:hypothetical protein